MKRYLKLFKQLLDATKFQKENLDELIEKYDRAKAGFRKAIQNYNSEVAKNGNTQTQNGLDDIRIKQIYKKTSQ